jgi:hypothetical protein
MTFFLFPPLVAGTAHLLTDSPHSVDFAVQFVVLAAVLVLLRDVGGNRAVWMISAPLMAAGLGGIVLHRLGSGVNS